jgi:acyl-coenzyme A synthetase/AMP-(fatty) acid ligase
VKIPAVSVEAQVREITQAADCSVLAVNLDGGATTLGIALVMPNPVNRDMVRRNLSERLRLGAAVGAKVIFLEALPRMSNAKMDRVRLHRMFESPPPGSL